MSTRRLDDGGARGMKESALRPEDILLETGDRGNIALDAFLSSFSSVSVVSTVAVPTAAYVGVADGRRREEPEEAERERAPVRWGEKDEGGKSDRHSGNMMPSGAVEAASHEDGGPRYHGLGAVDGSDNHADSEELSKGTAGNEGDGARGGGGGGGSRKATPLPKLQITILVLIMMTESIGAFMLLPFVGLYVAFMLGWSNDESGTLAGVAVGCYMLGQFISSKFWGSVSDRYGRKVPLVAGLWVCAVMMLLFGLSQHFAMACAVRFVQGLANGCVLIARTIVAEITDSTNVAKAFSCISFSWGFGSCIGSVVGGYLYDPVRQMHADPSGFFGRYPAFLPGVVCSAYMFFAWFMSAFFLAETNVRRQALVDILPSRCADGLARRFASIARSREAARVRLAKLEVENGGAEAEVEKAESRRVREEEHREGRDAEGTTAQGRADSVHSDGSASRGLLKPACLNSHSDHDHDHDHHDHDHDSCRHLLEGGRQSPEMGLTVKDQEELRQYVEFAAVPVFSAIEQRKSKLTYANAFRSPGIRYLTLIVGLWAAGDMAYSECLPLWCIASREVGGLAVYSDMVSILTLAMGAPTILSNLCFPWLCSKVADKRKLFRWAVVVWIVLTCVIPAGGDMQKSLGNSSGYWYVFAVGIPRQASLSVVYGVCWLLVPRVAPSQHIGETNGLVSSAASLMRCVVPFAAAPLFAWSVSSPNHHFPYNHFLIFLVAAIGGIATLGLSFLLPATPDTKPPTPAGPPPPPTASEKGNGDA